MRLSLRSSLGSLVHLFADLLRSGHQTFNSLINGGLVLALDLLFNVLDGALAGSAVFAFNLVAEILQGLLNLSDGGIGRVAGLSELEAAQKLPVIPLWPQEHVHPCTAGAGAGCAPCCCICCC